MEEPSMKIAFFGAGLMGSGFVRRLRAVGHEVNVWNRSAEKARALEADGARAFADPAAALAGAERLHLSLADDASVDAVLESLADAIAPGVWIVDHTTDRRSRRPPSGSVAGRGAAGPSSTRRCSWRRPNALEGTGLMLVSGRTGPPRHATARAAEDDRHRRLPG
jgi:3-hydroxyisobutyrate dehydrogenase